MLTDIENIDSEDVINTRLNLQYDGMKENKFKRIFLIMNAV